MTIFSEAQLEQVFIEFFKKEYYEYIRDTQHYQ